MTPSFTYHATVTAVVDGDTIDLQVDLGFGVSIPIRTCLYGIKAPDLGTPAGQHARDYLLSKLPVGTLVTVATFKPSTDDRSRWPAFIVRSDGTLVNDLMVRSGHATSARP